MNSSINSTTKWQVVQLKDVPPMPWRNGGGTTRELLAWPQAQAWQWRASVAEVVQAGPFSSFLDAQRWFAVLEGDGVLLTVDGHPHMLKKSNEPLQFAGSAQTTCELLGGATQDFNLMLQAPATACMRRVTNTLRMTTDAPKIVAAYAYKKRATVQIGTEIYVLLPDTFGWMPAAKSVAIEVHASDALFMEIKL